MTDRWNAESLYHHFTGYKGDLPRVLVALFSFGILKVRAIDSFSDAVEGMIPNVIHGFQLFLSYFYSSRRVA